MVNDQYVYGFVFDMIDIAKIFSMKLKEDPNEQTVVSLYILCILHYSH